MNDREQIVSLTNQATLFLEQKNPQEALDCYRKALEIAQTATDSRLVSVLLNRIGNTYQLQGKIQDAVIAYETALKALESGNQWELDRVMNALSQASKNFYNSPETIPDLYNIQVAESLEAEVNDRALPIKLWLNVGNAYLRQPQEAPALNAYQEALKYPEIEANPLLKAYAIANIGEIHRRQKQLALAESELNQALQLFDRVNQPLEKRRAIAFLAALKRNQERLEESETLYRDALSLYDRAKDNLGKGRTLAALGRLYLEQKQFDEARSHYQQARAIAEAEKDFEVQGYCHWGLGCCYQEAGELDNAIAAFQECLKLIELRRKDLRTDEGKVSFLDSIKDVFDRLLIAHLDHIRSHGGDYRDALAIAEDARGRALHDLMGGNKRRHPQTQTPKNTNFIDVRQQAPGTFQEHNPETDRAIETSPLARLVFYVLLDRIAIFAVAPDGKVSGYVSPIGCDELEKRVARLRRSMQVDEAARGIDRKLVPIPDEIEPVTDSPLVSADTLLQEFYRDLVAPVADALPIAGEILAIEPHASLWLVPFAALQLPDRTWMSDRWSLVYTPSAQTLAEIRTEPSYAPLERSQVLVVGNPLMPKIVLPNGTEIALEPLSGAEAEAQAIVLAVGNGKCTLLLREQATESAVKECAQTHNIIHLATHGIAYTENPLDSFVAFSPTARENGLLTAREVAQNRDLPADTIVLSACQTGLGRVSGDGMLGLSRAFLIAGARTVVVSQWSVSDSATKELMVAFYHHYLASGNKAIALQLAMQQVRSISDYAHPRFWAAFVMVGAEV